MADQPNSAKRRPVDSLFGENEPPPPPISKRRPVDALFGDNEAPALPSYSVEPPQPVTPVSPPSPVLPQERENAAPQKSPAPLKSIEPPAPVVAPTAPRVDESGTRPSEAAPTARTLAPIAAAPVEPSPAPRTKETRAPSPIAPILPDIPETEPPARPMRVGPESETTPRTYASELDSTPPPRAFSSSFMGEPAPRTPVADAGNGISPRALSTGGGDKTSRTPAPSSADDPGTRPLLTGLVSEIPPRSYVREPEPPSLPAQQAKPPFDRSILDPHGLGSLPAEPIRVEQSAIQAPMDEPYFVQLPDTIRQLYQDVTTLLADSPSVGDYCIKLLLEARQAYLRQDYATAEFYVETVEAKLQRSARSAEIAGSPKMFFLWVWELAVLVASAALVTTTYVGGLTFFGMPLAPEFIILVRVVGWGGIGGVIGALYNMPWFFQYREYDPAYNANYFARPLMGLIIGGILFLMAQASMLAGNAVNPLLGGTATATDGTLPVGPWFLYALARPRRFQTGIRVRVLRQCPPGDLSPAQAAR